MVGARSERMAAEQWLGWPWPVLLAALLALAISANLLGGTGDAESVFGPQGQTLTAGPQRMDGEHDRRILRTPDRQGVDSRLEA
jgi:hypothetical protein